MQKIFVLLLTVALFGLTNLYAATADEELSAAILNKKHSAIKSALQNGANPNGKDEYGSAIYKAVALKDKEAVSILLESGAVVDVDSVAVADDAMLSHFAQKTDFNANVIQAEGEYYNILHIYILTGNDDMVKKALKYANAGTKSKGGVSPLFMALSVGKLSIAKMLVDKKADVNAEDANGNNILIYIIEAKKADKEMLEYFIKAGTRVDSPNHSGARALDYAIIKGNLAVATLLVNNGASVNPSEKYDPLIIAMQYEQPEIVTFLIERGAKPDVRSMNQFLHKSVDNKKYLDNIKIAINKGYDINNVGGMTPNAHILFTAVILYYQTGSDEYFDIAEYMLENGADPEFNISEDINLPLGQCSLECNIESVDYTAERIAVQKEKLKALFEKYKKQSQAGADEKSALM